MSSTLSYYAQPSATNATDTAQCVLSPSARAFSTILTAFLGAIINGLNSGLLVAFCTGWVAYAAWLRVILSAICEFFLAPQETSYSESEVTFFGFLNWLWAAVYTPISQTIWLAVHYKSREGDIKLAHAVAIGVTAVSLATDTKHRYAEYLGGLYFKLWHASMCLLLGIECSILLVKGAIDLPVPGGIIAVYCIVSIIWTAASFVLLPLEDGKRKFPRVTSNECTELLASALVGALTGLIVAAPALAMLTKAQFEADVASKVGGTATRLSIREYLSCQEASIAQKWAAIMP